FADLRLCVARLEGRKGALVEAARHLEGAREILSRDPNLKIESQLHLDACMIALLRGDHRAALDELDSASTAAKRSGYFRGSVGATVDRAHVLLANGRLTEARALAEAAVSRSEHHYQLQVAALDCLANVLIGTGDIPAAEDAFAKILSLRPRH